MLVRSQTKQVLSGQHLLVGRLVGNVKLRVDLVGQYTIKLSCLLGMTVTLRIRLVRVYVN